MRIPVLVSLRLLNIGYRNLYFCFLLKNVWGNMLFDRKHGLFISLRLFQHSSIFTVYYKIVHQENITIHTTPAKICWQFKAKLENTSSSCARCYTMYYKPSLTTVVPTDGLLNFGSSYFVRTRLALDSRTKNSAPALSVLWFKAEISTPGFKRSFYFMYDVNDATNIL